MTTKARNRIRKNTSLWAYLDSVGVLENGTEEEIKQAKKQYWKKYFLQYKQNRRKDRPEFPIGLSKKNGEYERIKRAASSHNMTTSSFLKKSALAYINKVYLVPDRQQVSGIEQMLSQILNEVRQRKNLPYMEIEKRIEAIEMKVDKLLRHPPEIIATINHDR
ncbi:MAG: hypothetical protein HY840_08805 [Bacteroidetes bacterium]|nr:hypothetical protein [Bacteroidota bacterium]